MGNVSGLAKKNRQRIGLISDTHGLVRPQALDALKSVDLIIHAGDIGTPEVIKQLESIATVVAIKGNNDRGAWAKALPETTSVKAAAARLYVIHNVKELAFDPAAGGFHAVDELAGDLEMDVGRKQGGAHLLEGGLHVFLGQLAHPAQVAHGLAQFLSE